MGRNIVIAMMLGGLTAVAFFFIWSLFFAPTEQKAILPTLAASVSIPNVDEEVIGTVLPQNTAVSAPTMTRAPLTYTIQAGDTLFSISRTHNLTLIELTAANGIVNPNQIEVGQQLVIPNAMAESVDMEDTAVQIEVVTPTVLLGASVRQTTMNGVPINGIIIMPENVIANAKNIYAHGQTLGNNPQTFSKIGDSTIQIPYFLARFEQPGSYNLGDYAYLQPTIDFFVGSFNREGMAVRKGFHSWSVMDPAWADKSVCQANETPIACEIRIQRPSLIFIRLGSNDAGVPDMFDQNIRQIVEYAIANGVIPVIGTKADRAEGSNINNDVLRRIATDYQLPLWEFDIAAGTIPGRGLDIDDVHLTTFYAHDYTSPTAFQQGHSVHNLTALMMLDAIMNQIILAQ